MLLEPKIPPQLRRIDSLAAEHAEGLPLRAVSMEGDTLCESDLSGLEVRGGTFTNCGLSGCNLEHSAFIDVYFTDCNFSNAHLTDSYFERCRFQNCKCVGTDFSGSVLKGVCVEDCAFSLARFDRAGFTGVLFRSCDWTEVSCTEASLRDFRVERSRLIRVSFFRTPLCGVDVSENELRGLVVSDTLRELRGMTVSPLQAVELVSLCGVKVK